MPGSDRFGPLNARSNQEHFVTMTVDEYETISFVMVLKIHAVVVAAGIKAANIKIYKTINDSVMDNIDAPNNSKLSLLVDIHAGFHNHGEK